MRKEKHSARLLDLRAFWWATLNVNRNFVFKKTTFHTFFKSFSGWKAACRCTLRSIWLSLFPKIKLERISNDTQFIRMNVRILNEKWQSVSPLRTPTVYGQKCRALDCDQNGHIHFLCWYELKFYVVAFVRVAESGNTVKSAKYAKSGNGPLSCWSVPETKRSVADYFIAPTCIFLCWFYWFRWTKVFHHRLVP